MKHKKKLEYLNVRIKDWVATCARLESRHAGASRGYRKPGSQTK